MGIGTGKTKLAVNESSRLVKSHERICEIWQIHAKTAVTKWDRRKETDQKRMWIQRDFPVFNAFMCDENAEALSQSTDAAPFSPETFYLVASKAGGILVCSS
jgi:hypothetical protein